MKRPAALDDPGVEDAEQEEEYARRIQGLAGELHAGQITHAEYQLRKQEAWEIYLARSGLQPSGEDEGPGRTSG